MSLGSEIVSRIVGYSLTTADFSDSSPNLPIRVGILAQPNEANEALLVLNSDNVPVPVQITNLAQAALLGGFGSPIYQIAKILFPTIGSIPVIVYPQLKAVGATAKAVKVTATGTATGNGTHTIVIAGRKLIGGQSYSFNISNGDTNSIIHQKISDTVNAALGSPMMAYDADYYAALTSKHKGATANDITVSIDTGGNPLGISYTITTTAVGVGTPAVTPSLNLFANNWVTHVINGYGTVSATMDELEAYNGVPVIGNAPATGRYQPTVFKPFLAYTGTVANDPSNISDARKGQVTIKLSPAPQSLGLPMEAAANDCLNAALIAQNSPHLDVIGQPYIDMPTPDNIGLMASFIERQRMILKGCSTVDLVNGVYVIVDPVTTYHPDGEVPPQFRFARILVIDWNVRFTYLLKEQVNVLGHVIVQDNESVAASDVVKPKLWKAVVADMAEELVLRGLIVDAAFMIASIVVGISTVNPDRLQTFFRYKRSGVVRVADTTAQAGFQFGTLTAN